MGFFIIFEPKSHNLYHSFETFIDKMEGDKYKQKWKFFHISEQ